MTEYRSHACFSCCLLDNGYITSTLPAESRGQHLSGGVVLGIKQTVKWLVNVGDYHLWHLVHTMIQKEILSMWFLEDGHSAGP